MTWKASRYNHTINLEGGSGLIYNGRTGSILELSGTAYEAAKSLLSCYNLEQDGTQAIDDNLFPHLAGGGFLVESSLDELGAIEQQYQYERKRSQFLLTILPTFACNLGCEYCFVGKKHGIMQRDVQERLIEFVRNRLSDSSEIPSMNVDWFGGEPLLALPVITHLSSEFTRLCDDRGIPYRAQVISNGTVLNDEVSNALQAARVDRLQITLDGPQQMHDSRRFYKAGKKSSFETILRGLPAVVGKFLIRLRINVDARNLHYVWDLLDTFAENKWIGPETRFFPYLARISPFTDACSGVSDLVCSMEDFYRVQFRWMQRLEQLGVSVAEQGLYQFPEPKLYNCGAVGANGFVFTPEGEVHKCGLTVDDSREAVGHLQHEIALDASKMKKWDDYSPLTNPVCRSCEFLPTCLGGCPRNQMESRVVQMKENCTYHMKYENQIMLFHLGHRSGIEFANEHEQPPETEPLFRILP